MMRLSLLFPFLIFLFSNVTLAEQPRLAPDEAISRLAEGNKRYSEGKISHPHQDRERRGDVSQGQKPFAAILSCADSRVPPEIIFDQGLGDIFVVRVAGHVLDDTSLASLEYAAEHLGISAILVLGHERCGAVSAAVAGGKLPGHLSALTSKINPVIAKLGDHAETEACIAENARYVAEQLRNSPPIISSLSNSGQIKIAAGKYDLDTGVVEFY